MLDKIKQYPGLSLTLALFSMFATAQTTTNVYIFKALDEIQVAGNGLTKSEVRDVVKAVITSGDTSIYTKQAFDSHLMLHNGEKEINKLYINTIKEKLDTLTVALNKRTEEYTKLHADLRDDISAVIAYIKYKNKDWKYDQKFNPKE